MEWKDPENVMLLFQFETQVMAWQKLPSIITDAEIASKIFTKRAQEVAQVGSRLGRFVVNGSIQSNGDLLWQKHGCFRLEIVDGKCTRVHHISGACATVPAHLTVTSEFVLKENRSDVTAKVELLLAVYTLHHFFAQDVQFKQMLYHDKSAKGFFELSKIEAGVVNSKRAEQEEQTVNTDTKVMKEVALLKSKEALVRARRAKQPNS
eukprot:1075045-Amphidinium_carterae.1